MKKSISFMMAIGLTLLLFITVFGTFSLYKGIEGYSVQRTANSSVNTINKTIQNVDISLQDIERMISSIMMDSYITSYFSQPIEEGTFEWVQRENDIRGRLLNYYVKSRSEILDIALVNLDGAVISSNSKLTRENIWQNEGYETAIEQEDPFVITTPRAYPFLQGDENSGLQYISMIKEYSLYGGSGNSIGYIVVNIDYSFIQDKLNNFILSEDEELLMMDETGNLLYTTNSGAGAGTEYTGYDGKEKAGYEIVHQDNLINIVAFSTSGYTNWTILSKTPIHDSLIVGGYIVFFVIIYVAAIAIFSYLMMVKVLHPIISVKNAMLKVEQGNLEVSVRENEWAELGVLSKGFNSMVNEITNLIGKIIREEDEKKDIQLKVLQSQINPHFLYNTLNTIRIMASSYGAEDIMEAVTSLIDLLRITISNPNEFITVNEEIEHVKSYMKIQKLRYGDNINLDISISDEVGDYLTPKLILQPIVENALFHGLEPKSYAGTVSVGGEVRGDNIVITIADDGVGMGAAQLDALRKMIGSGEDRGSSGSIGISNIDKRIKLHFGEKYGVRLNAEPGKGMCVELIFPRMK